MDDIANLLLSELTTIVNQVLNFLPFGNILITSYKTENDVLMIVLMILPNHGIGFGSFVNLCHKAIKGNIETYVYIEQYLHMVIILVKNILQLIS